MTADGATLSTVEVADLLGVDVKTIRKALDDGTFPLPAVRIGRNWRISRAGLERLLADLAEPTRVESA